MPAVPEKMIDGFSISLAGNRYYFRGGEGGCFNFSGSISVARNKFCVNRLLEKAGIPVPNAIGITKKQFEENDLGLGAIKFPVVAKPTIDSMIGTDVFCNIKDEITLRSYLKKMFVKYPTMSVEEFQPDLRSYRVLVFYGKVIGVLERISAHVIGDGVHTLNELITITNQKRLAIADKVSVGPIELAEEQYERMADLGITLNDIPEKGKYIRLCHKCNSSVGGTIRSADNQICQTNVELVVKAAKILSLNLVGFDVLCEDIRKPIGPTRGFIIEANYNPDVSIHENTMYGEKNRVTLTILRRFIWQHPMAFLSLKFNAKKFFKSFYFKFGATVATLLIFQHFIKG
ncbi:MAG: hypothetical protein A3F17_03785 [Gammaproteobacteria bacterium RIFCSPHIGHO2_12_FULL_41_15]|nr:MAG: hypothetical protein A3F17_03785 [Gammaproteobacteria bacterium RIFCSPHIGHO2_12_FULL_41_15]